MHRNIYHIEGGRLAVCEIAEFARRNRMEYGNIRYTAIGLLSKATADSSAVGREARVPECLVDICDNCEISRLWDREVKRRRATQNS